MPPSLLKKNILKFILKHSKDKKTGPYEEADGTICKSADSVKWWGVIDTHSDRALVQRNLQVVEDWTKEKFMILNKKKCYVLQLGQNKPNISTRW